MNNKELYLIRDISNDFIVSVASTKEELEFDMFTLIATKRYQFNELKIDVKEYPEDKCNDLYQKYKNKLNIIWN